MQSDRLTQQSTAAVNLLCHGASSSSTADSYLLSGQSYSFQTGSKRTASATNQNPLMAFQEKYTEVTERRICSVCEYSVLLGNYTKHYLRV